MRRRTRRGARRLAGMAAVLAAATLLAGGCVSLPEDGPVVQARSQGNADGEPGVFIDPRPPQKGESAPDVVNGFLDAMTATPVQTNVAKQYLAQQAAASWNPELETITYDDASQPDGQISVTVRLSGANRLDARGVWRGALPAGRRLLRFPMVLEDGEWRIARAPNALIVPEPWFEQRFQQVSLYFFDPTAQVLVPEPAYVPGGRQLASALTNGLLRGPGPGLAGVARTFIPPGLGVGLSVPVSEDGVADLSLRGDAGQLTADNVQLMVAQLAWTLRQEPSITALRISIGGEQVQLPGDGVFSVDEGSEYSPARPDASSSIYALRKGLLVAGTAGKLEAVGGPFGTTAYGLRSVAVDLEGDRAAAVSGGGRSLLTASVHGPSASVVQLVSGADDLLRPAWDFRDRLWLVDRTPEGARLSYIDRGKPREVTVPGITGRTVKRFLVSRDGSRLVAVVRARGGDVLMVSRIRYDEQGRVLGLTPGRAIRWEGGAGLRLRDVGWLSPTTLVVLYPLTDDLWQVRSVPVDGSPSGGDRLSTTLSEPVTSLVASPDSGRTLYAVTGTELLDLSQADRSDAALDPRTASLGYAG